MKHYGIENIGIITSDILSMTLPTGLTLSSDTITVTQSVHTVDTEASAATDNLSTINGNTDGRLLLLRAANAGRITTVLETGNINAGGASVALSATKYLIFIYDTTLSKWVIIGGSGSSGGSTAYFSPTTYLYDTTNVGSDAGTALSIYPSADFSATIDGSIWIHLIFKNCGFSNTSDMKIDLKYIFNGSIGSTLINRVTVDVWVADTAETPLVVAPDVTATTDISVPIANTGNIQSYVQNGSF